MHSRISYELTDDGFNVNINGDTFEEKYPKAIWQDMPYDLKRSVVENFISVATFSLPLMDDFKSISYDFPEPLLESFFHIPIQNYIPVASGSKNSPYDDIKKLMNTRREYLNSDINHINYKIDPEERVINFMTFGKDSLLSYAIAEELGLKPVAVYIEEPDIPYVEIRDGKQVEEKMYEKKHKNVLIERFSREFNTKINLVSNGLGRIRYPEYFKKSGGDYGWATNLTEYSFLSIPFNHHFKAKYILYGHEASCSDQFEGEDGLISYPVFEQSKKWTIETSKMIYLLTRSFEAMSLLEPIHEIAITRILHKRYPQYGKYQMSCFADNNHAEHSRWCHHCSKCARMYVFMKAIGVDTKTVEFKEDMFSKEKEGLYAIFGLDGQEEIKLYDKSGLGSDEMLFAFYLAHKNGATGYLMDKFRKELLPEVELRAHELEQTFFGIHSFDTIPAHLRPAVRKIYEEEFRKKL